MSATSRAATHRVLLSLFVLAVGGAIAWAMGVLPSNVEDVGPDDSVDTPTHGSARNATSGGRIQNLAIDPTDDNVLYAASEWGGLFKSFDGASSWIQLDDHLPQATWDIAVDPGNTRTVYATSLYDSPSPSLGGMSVSYDGGQSWAHPASVAPPPSCRATARRSIPSSSASASRFAPTNPAMSFSERSVGIGEKSCVSGRSDKYRISQLLTG